MSYRTTGPFHRSDQPHGTGTLLTCLVLQVALLLPVSRVAGEPGRLRFRENLSDCFQERLFRDGGAEDLQGDRRGEDEAFAGVGQTVNRTFLQGNPAVGP